jgi:hypothetical protein
MDNFDLKPERKVDRQSVIWNILTIVVVLASCCLAYYFLSIFKNPNVALNPFPPVKAIPTLTLFQTDTPTHTVIPLDATWTPTITLQLSPSRTRAATLTLVYQLITPSVTTTPTITSTPMPASAVITHLASTTYHSDKKCNWLGVAGKVLGTDGEPLLSQQILLGGTLDGKLVNSLTLSGLAPAYGPSGFEIVLRDHPIASIETIWIQLLDDKAKPLTNKIYFETYDDCVRNLVMVVFSRTR